jgi:fatty acid desaturase
MTSIYKPDFNKMKLQVQIISKVKPLIYWFDLMISGILSWSLFYLALKITFHHPIYYLLIILSAIGLYRVVAFTHELVHLKKGSLPGFHLVWHLICGIPLLAPHFLYKSIHIAHHSRKEYGKKTDGEYIEFGTESRRLIIVHLMYNFVIPIFSIIRFMILAIISFCHPSLRLFVMKKMSFMGLRFTFDRNIPSQKSELIAWYLEEISCCLFTWAIFGLILAGKLSVSIIFQWYVILTIILTLNSLRSIGATHWYTSRGGDTNFKDQIMDSITVTSNSLFTHLFCPVGTQYHSLHHMFPFVPYHDLSKVYHYLLYKFPEEKILLETSNSSLVQTWKKVWLLPRKNNLQENKIYSYNKQVIKD